MMESTLFDVVATVSYGDGIARLNVAVDNIQGVEGAAAHMCCEGLGLVQHAPYQWLISLVACDVACIPAGADML